MSVVAGDLGIMMPTGRVLADDGVLYDTVQAAENAASSFIWIGPGTFSEAVTIDTAGLMVLGSGRGTLIDGGTTGHAIEVSASNVLIQNLSVQTTAGQGNSFNGILLSGGEDGNIVDTVWVRQSDNQGIIWESKDTIISNVIVEGSDGGGIRAGALSGKAGSLRSIIKGCIVTGVGGFGISSNEPDCIAVSNIVRNPGADGLALFSSGSFGDGGNNCILTDNRVHGAGQRGADISSTDAILAKNRISGSTNADIRVLGTDTVLSANRTGAAN